MTNRDLDRVLTLATAKLNKLLEQIVRIFAGVILHRFNFNVVYSFYVCSRFQRPSYKIGFVKLQNAFLVNNKWR